MSRSGVGAGLPALVRVIKLVIRLKTYLFDFRFTFVNGQFGQCAMKLRTFLSSKVTGKLRRASDLTLSLTFLQSLSSLTRCTKECTKVVFTSFVVSVQVYLAVKPVGVTTPFPARRLRIYQS